MGVIGATLRNQMADAIDEIIGVEADVIVFDEVEVAINLEIEAERKVKYGKGFGSWG